MEIKTTNKKISQAMREGNLPRVEGRIFKYEKGKFCGCVIGSALAGVYGKKVVQSEFEKHNQVDGWAWDVFYKTFGLELTTEDGGVTPDYQLTNQIWQLNDNDHKSIEEIASELEAQGV